jgi:NAD(P)-dependent dehydrogenase (short-subunit alcohol dehydrogenase family)
MTRKELPGISQFDLTGKAAIVTGGSKGLGFSMAAGLASAGASVMIVCRNAEEGIVAAEMLRDEYGVNVVSFTADITDILQT